METWTWTKHTDEDQHPYWKGVSSRGGSVIVWRAGGDAGDYINENDDRRKTLAGAKAAAQRWAEAIQ
jgi:hypothetical protein